MPFGLAPYGRNGTQVNVMFLGRKAAKTANLRPYSRRGSWSMIGAMDTKRKRDKPNLAQLDQGSRLVASRAAMCSAWEGERVLDGFASIGRWKRN